MRAAIVAGGFGTRATQMTGGRIPKALLPVAGVPIIIHQMRVLRREGITQANILAGHLGDQLARALTTEAESLGMELQINIEEVPLGTAGCLANLDPAPTEEVLVVNGDMLFDMFLARLFEFHQRQHAVVTIVAHPNDHPRTSDLLVEEEGLVKAILPVGQPRIYDYRNLVPAGVYLAAPCFFRSLDRSKKADMIRDVLPQLVAANVKIAVYNTPEYLRDVGTTARHEVAERDWNAGRVKAMNHRNVRPAIFFDCDGVLNVEPGPPGIVAESNVELIPGAGDAVRRARDAGLLTVAITNRPQVAKGLITFDDLSHILGRLEACLAHNGGVLDRIYFCPHHPEAGFAGEVPSLKIICECRKPGTLLLRQAFADLPIDRGRSAFVGDSVRDIAAARGAGIWAYGVRTGYGCGDDKSGEANIAHPVPDLMFDDVSEAVDFQINFHALAAPVIPEIQRLIDSKRHPVLIGICGQSRSGKTSTAHAILRVLNEYGISCLHVRLDHWIVGAGDRKQNSSAEDRNRVDSIPEIIRLLRAGRQVHAPGYDPKTRLSANMPAYDPTGQSVIFLDGVFAGHATIRSLLDYSIFIAAPSETKRSRFFKFYRWKGFANDAIETLWFERSTDEHPIIDTQRNFADLILTSGDSHL